MIPSISMLCNRVTQREGVHVKENIELKGLGGWLILIGIGAVLSPIRLLISSIQIYHPIFTDGTWEALTTIGSEVYHPLWKPLLLGEIIFNVGMVTVSIYLIYLFFAKHYLFPKFFIGIFAASVIFIPLDAWLISFVAPNEPMFDPETTKEFTRVLVTILIWVPYMLVSKRVKATYVEKMPNNTLNQIDTNNAPPN